jgi:rubrerythrin
MTEIAEGTTETGISTRGQFIRNAAKGSLVLVGSGGVLATMDGVAFAKTSRATKSDITVLQTGFIAETLAVAVYEAIVNTYAKKFKFPNSVLPYFVEALKNEKSHLAAWKEALGTKNVPTGFKLTVPAKYVASKTALINTGVTLEAAFVSTYLGAIDEFSSAELKTTAGGVAANEATHYSFLDALTPDGTATLPPFGPKPITAATAAKTLTKLGFLSS